MDGLTCVKKIRELQEEGKIVAHVPVIAVTANARSEQIATAKDSGMDGVVTNPFRVPELMPKMEKQIRKGAERIEMNRSISAPPPSDAGHSDRYYAFVRIHIPRSGIDEENKGFMIIGI